MLAPKKRGLDFMIVRRYLYTLSRISVLCVHDTTSPCTSHMNTRTAHSRYSTFMISRPIYYTRWMQQPPTAVFGPSRHDTTHVWCRAPPCHELSVWQGALGCHRIHTPAFTFTPRAHDATLGCTTRTQHRKAQAQRVWIADPNHRSLRMYTCR